MSSLRPHPGHGLPSADHLPIGGVVADFGRSCLPGRTSRLAATSVHVNRQYRLAVSLARRRRFALRRKSFPAERTHLPQSFATTPLKSGNGSCGAALDLYGIREETNVPIDQVVSCPDGFPSSQFRKQEFGGESDTDSSIGTIIGCGRTGTLRN